MDTDHSLIATRFWKTILSIMIALGLGYVGVWMSILAAHEPINHPLSHFRIWPVACSVRGCVSSAVWLRQHELGLTFAKAANQDLPNTRESLSTSVRRHQVEHAFLRSPVTLADARRYREEVLRITDNSAVKDVLGINLDTYDEEILLPWLQQEALRVELKVESTQELYGKLSDDRPIILLPFRFSWHAEIGEVVQ